MTKIIFQLVVLMIGIILLIGGLVFGVKGVSMVLDELIVINENIGYGIEAVIYGCFIFTIGYRIIKYLIKD